MKFIILPFARFWDYLKEIPTKFKQAYQLWLEEAKYQFTVKEMPWDVIKKHYGKQDNEEEAKDNGKTN